MLGVCVRGRVMVGRKGDGVTIWGKGVPERIKVVFRTCFEAVQ